MKSSDDDEEQNRDFLESLSCRLCLKCYRSAIVFNLPFRLVVYLRLFNKQTTHFMPLFTTD